MIDNSLAGSSPREAAESHSDGQVGTVGVVLVTYQSADDLPSFLESLPAAVAPYPFEVVAVDNASSDESVRIVREFGAVVAANTANVGLSAAINQAAAMTSADWLLIANPDTRLTENSIARLVETARSDDRIGCVGPRIRSLDGTSYPTGRRFPSVGIGIAHAVLGTVWKNNPATHAYFGRSDGGDVDWVSGSCMVFRRSAFDAIGGFDTGYFMYFEETDACLQLHRKGWRVIFEPDVEVYHREGGSTRFAPFRKVYNHHRSALRFYCRQHHRDPWLLLAPLIAAGLAARASVSLLRTDWPVQWSSCCMCPEPFCMAFFREGHPGPRASGVVAAGLGESRVETHQLRVPPGPGAMRKANLIGRCGDSTGW